MSLLFVVVQFAALVAIFLTGPLFAAHPILLVVEGLGLLVGVWAVLAMGLFNFNITPDPKRSAELVTRGPYALIRHPMYTSLLLLTLPLLIDSFSFLRLIFWLILLVDLVFKLDYEEGLLQDKLPGYRDYMSRSKRLLPFIY
jgi:protein-S-isoprenylcysteine O-methyltransferase Ste14